MSHYDYDDGHTKEEGIRRRKKAEKERKLTWAKGKAEGLRILHEMEKDVYVPWTTFAAELASRSHASGNLLNFLIDSLKNDGDLERDFTKGIKRGQILHEPDPKLLSDFQRSWLPVKKVSTYRTGTVSASNEMRNSKTLSIIHRYLDEGAKIMVVKPNGEQEELVFTLE